MSAIHDNAKSIFVAAIEKHSPGQWPAYLNSVCGDNSQLRERVAQLLEAHAALGSIRCQSPSAGGITADHTALVRPGTELGAYKLLEVIGEGGMGVVYMAEQMEPVERRVALKIIKPGMDSRQVIARFEAERQALAMMDHPNIAKVLDAGTTGEVQNAEWGVRSEEADAASTSASIPHSAFRIPHSTGRPYFVMELVKGVPITKYCDEQHLTLQERLELFLPVCQAIQHAHQKGIIHRDIKPTNILVALYDGVPVPKVIDFGVAKATHQKLTEKTMFTGFGQLVGTLEYMSPEQAQFNQLDVDTRSDVYSLGVLLYELLTGTTPLEQSRIRTVAFDETLRIIREEEPPRPSTRLSTADALPSIAANRNVEPAQLRRQVRGDLDWIVMKALDKDRNCRYQSASDLTLDIQKFLRDDPVGACPPSVAYRLRKLVRRNKRWLAFAAAALLAVTVMAASIGWVVRDRAARKAEMAQAETARQAKVQGLVRDSLNTARAFIADNNLPAAREKLAEARAQLANDRSGLGQLAAEVEARQVGLDRYQKFLERIDRAHQAETALAQESPLAAGTALGGNGVLAPASTGQRRLAAAVTFRRRALETYDVLARDYWNSDLEVDLLGKQQAQQIRRVAYEELLWLADDVLRRRQDHVSEEKLSLEAAARAAQVYLDKAESAYQPTTTFFLLRARCHNLLGDRAAGKADRQRAEQTPPTLALDHFLRGQAALGGGRLDEAVTAFEAALRQEPTHYWSLMNLGYGLCDLGQEPEDFSAAARVFTGCIMKRPDHAHAYVCRANAYSKLRRYEEAVADHSKAIELDPSDPFAWGNRGVVYHMLGQYELAAADFSQAIERDPKFARAWYNRAISYTELGQRDKAIADCSQAIVLEPKFAPAWYSRGYAYNELGQPDKALPDYSKAVELDPKLAPAWHNRGLIYARLGQLDNALADYSRAIELDPKFAPAWLNRGSIHDNSGQPDKAVADFSQAIELDPQYALAWFNRGNAYLKLGQPSKSVADFTKAIELDPKSALAWNNRGFAYNFLGQPDRAIADLSQAIELAANDTQLAEAHLLRGQAHCRLGHFEQARTDYQTALSRAPNHAGVNSALAWLLATCPDADMRQPDKAVELANKAVQLAPKSGICWKTLGVAHYRAGDCQAAIAALDKSLEIQPKGDAASRLFLAMSHWKLGNHEEARAAYEQAAAWLETNKQALEKDQGHAEELRRFQREAEELMQKESGDRGQETGDRGQESGVSEQSGTYRPLTPDL